MTKESFISFLVLMPYFVGRFTNQLFFIRLSPNAYIMPTMVIMTLFMILFRTITPTRAKNFRPRKYALFIGLIILDAAIGIVFSQDTITAISVWLRLCLPMILSLMIVKYCRVYNLDFGKILEGMLKWFTLYAALMLSYYVVFRGVFVDSSVRFNPRGGGSVIFGYTVAIIFSLALCVKDRLRPEVFYSVLIVLTIVAFATGSRGAIWPIILLWIINFVLSRGTPQKVIAIFCMICGVIFLLGTTDILSLIGDFSKTDSILARIFRFGSVEREISTQNALSVIAKSDVIDFIFGFGTGGLFPIQRWEIQVRGGETISHYFDILGESLLVQPHNTFLYALIENGFIGFGLWVFLFVSICYLLIKNRNYNYIYQVMVVGMVIFTNLFDSIMFIQPGVATVIWLVLWCICEQSQNQHEKKITRLEKVL